MPTTHDHLQGLRFAALPRQERTDVTQLTHFTVIVLVVSLAQHEARTGCTAGLIVGLLPDWSVDDYGTVGGLRKQPDACVEGQVTRIGLWTLTNITGLRLITL